MVIDEIRQIFKPKGTLKDRLSIWWSDIWNKFDCFGFLLFVLSIIYRLILITQGRIQSFLKVWHLIFLNFRLKSETYLDETASDCWIQGTPECCPLTVDINFQWFQILYSCSYIVFTLRFFNFYITR